MTLAAPPSQGWNDLSPERPQMNASASRPPATPGHHKRKDRMQCAPGLALYLDFLLSTFWSSPLCFFSLPFSFLLTSQHPPREAEPSTAAEARAWRCTWGTRSRARAA